MKLIESFLKQRRHAAERHTLPRRAVVTLGGGGARGLAHLGAMEAIGESGVQTERIVGVSIGGLIGGLVAMDKDIHRVQAKAMQLLYSPVFSKQCNELLGSASGVETGHREDDANNAWFSSWYHRARKLLHTGQRIGRLMRGPALMSSEVLQEAIEQLVPDVDLSETSTPLTIIAADLVTGHRVMLEKGSLRKAILASTAIPGFFPPVPWGDALLCDIGVLDSLPLQLASVYASDLTIGVDVGSGRQLVERCDSAIEVMMRVEEIGEQLCRRNSIRYADILIKPNVGDRPWYDFRHPGRLVDEGRRAGREVMAAWLRSSRLRSPRRKSSRQPNKDESVHHVLHEIA